MQILQKPFQQSDIKVIEKERGTLSDRIKEKRRERETERQRKKVREERHRDRQIDD